MKTERRHELQHNELADWLADKIEQIKPYSRAIVGGLIAVLVIFGIYLYLSRQRAAVAAEGWDLYFKGWEQVRTRDNADELAELAQSTIYRDTAAGMWARIALADYNYAHGESHLATDSAQAKQELKTAVDNYSPVAIQTEYPLLAQRAMLGKARALESLNDQDEARKAYENLAETAGGLYQEAAKKRLADLSEQSTKQFYDWFALQNERPRSQFAPGIPGLRPDFDLNSLKSDPSLFDRPPAGDPTGDLPLTPAKGQPGSEEPPAKETSPATTSDADKKAGESKAAEKPADKAATAPSAGPATSTPAEADKKSAEKSPAATPPKDGGKKWLCRCTAATPSRAR